MMRRVAFCCVLSVLVDREDALAPTLATRRGALERAFLSGALVTSVPALAAADGTAASTPRSSSPPPPAAPVWRPNGVVLKNGLRYFDFEEGSGPTPRWGQVVSFAFTQSVRQKPGAKLQKIFSTDGYLIKHGNGRTIKGLDEGLHTMKVGGRRRIEVPEDLAYVQGGLGPLPEWAPTYRKFEKALKDMEPGGAIVFDVTMNKIKTDGADRGYYEDNSFTEDELKQIIANTEAVAKQLAREARKKDPLSFPEARQPELTR